LAVLPTEEAIGRVLADGPAGCADVRGSLTDAHAAAWRATSPRLLELCRVRIAMLLGCATEAEYRSPAAGVGNGVLESLARWPTDPQFDEVDRACLAFTEHYLIDVASIDDATVEAIRSHLGDAGTQNFVNALLVVEQRIRMRLMWDRLDLDISGASG
jgi:alkylhydroperoxidase family enzyme